MPKNVLVADDSLTIRKVIGMVLSNEDMQVTLVDNGLEAIQRARDSRPDVVVADVMMPGKSGYEVCQAIKQDPSTSHIPVMLLAGTFEPFDENRARASGADTHIAKPFESQAFIDKVRGLVGLAPGQAMIPTYGPVSTTGPVAARPAAPAGPGQGAPSGPPPGGMGTRPMPGPAGMPGQSGRADDGSPAGAGWNSGRHAGRGSQSDDASGAGWNGAAAGARARHAGCGWSHDGSASRAGRAADGTTAGHAGWAAAAGRLRAAAGPWAGSGHAGWRSASAGRATRSVRARWASGAGWATDAARAGWPADGAAAAAADRVAVARRQAG
jgi:CheY-like chemotaxis protein